MKNLIKRCLIIFITVLFIINGVTGCTSKNTNMITNMNQNELVELYLKYENADDGQKNLLEEEIINRINYYDISNDSEILWDACILLFLARDMDGLEDLRENSTSRLFVEIKRNKNIFKEFNEYPTNMLILDSFEVLQRKGFKKEYVEILRDLDSYVVDYVDQLYVLISLTKYEKIEMQEKTLLKNLLLEFEKDKTEGFTDKEYLILYGTIRNVYDSLGESVNKEMYDKKFEEFKVKITKE